MATTAQAASNANSNSTPAGRPQLKSSSSSVGNRRAAQSPVEAPQRRNSQKPWATPSQQKFNGAAPQSSSPTPAQAAAMKSRGPGATSVEAEQGDRTTYVLAHLVNKKVVVTHKSGAQYSGTMMGSEARNGLSCALCNVTVVKTGSNDKAKVGDEEKSMIFEEADVVDVVAENIKLGEVEEPTQANGVGGWKTDADISGNLSVRERALHRWEPEEPDSGLSLEDHGNSQEWDQFAANERLFGLRTDFDENIYTTKIDRSHPNYQKREAEAARLASEIQSSSYGNNAHMAEERGINVTDDSGMDEEDKYSGVQRTRANLQQNPNRYTPPALRAPSGQPTVTGAPHDPAIISSQLARPETLQTKQPQAPPTAKHNEDLAKAKEQLLRQPGGQPPRQFHNGKPIEKEITQSFKKFVYDEKEKVKKKRQDMAVRDRESKLNDLKKFSAEFTLKSDIPQDLVPILAKDKQKQEVIKAKARQNVSKLGAGSVPINSVGGSASQASSAAATPGAQPKNPDSFAAKQPERFRREIEALKKGVENLSIRRAAPAQHLAQNLQRLQQNPAHPVRAPVPIPEVPRGHQYPPPTGPAAATAQQSGPGHAGPPKRLNVNAKPFDFKPNPQAVAFTPTLGPSNNATPSPTASVHAHASRAASPSFFFGSNKRPKSASERPSLEENFNPFKRMKATKAADPSKEDNRKKFGNANDYIDKPFACPPTWPTTQENDNKKHSEIFTPVDPPMPGNIHSPHAPPMVQHQPHHQQLPHSIPPHMSQQVPHQPQYDPMMQAQMGPPPHYPQDTHNGQNMMSRQMSNNPPTSVMPSPNLHSALPYPSPVPHPAVPAYSGGPPPPGAPQFHGYRSGPVPYPGGPPVPVHYGSPHASFAYPVAPPNQGGPTYSPQPQRPPQMMMGVPGVPQYGMPPGQGQPMYPGQGPQMMPGRGPPHHGPPPQYGFPGGPPHFQPGPGGRGNHYTGPTNHQMPPPHHQNHQPRPQMPQPSGPPPQQQPPPPQPPQQPAAEATTPAGEGGESKQ